ncbi:MAG: ribosome recycling factor [Patescibacteria group bacterium]
MQHLEAMRNACDETIAHLKQEVASLRTGRANPMLVEDIQIEAYGARQPIKNVATITTPDPRLIQIAPWDRTVLPAIEKAIIAANIGLNPSSDGVVVRLPIPSLTEETRKELVKNLKTRLEGAKIRVRQHREECRTSINADEKAGTMTEDQKFHDMDKLDELTKSTNEKIEILGAEKEAEIMKI